MKKNLLTSTLSLLIALLAGQTLLAQHMGSYYSFSESTGTYTEISGGFVSTASGDDGAQNTVPIGFDFEYAQTIYTTVTIGVNGAISFTSNNIVYDNYLNSTIYNNLNYVAPLWDDLYARSEDNYEIRYKTAGSVPNRTFTVQWKNLSWRNSGSTVNFQIVLYEGSNNIDLNYGVNNSTEYRTASIGLNVSPGGAENFISVTPGSPATTSTSTANNSINSTNYPGDGHIYSFTYNPPTCPAPENQAESNITINSASLEWTTGGSSTWNIEYGPLGFTKGTGTMITGTTLNPYPLGGLNSGTYYDWYVQDDCGGGDESFWTGPSTFATVCTPYSAPFSEDFDGVTTPPDLPICWSKIVISNSSNSHVQTYSGFTPNSNPNQALIYDYYDTAAVLLLISPQLNDLSNQLNQISFFAKGNGDGYSLIVGTITDPTNATTFSGFDTISLTDTHQEYTVIFGSAYTGSDEYIAFKHGDVGYQHLIFIDDFVYDTIPDCPAPSHLSSTNITPNGADLSWADNYGSNWDLYIVPTGDPAPTQDTTPTINDISSNPYTWTGGNTYTTYDWYVRSDCDHDNTGTSYWRGPNTFKTLQTPAPVQSIPFTEDWESGVIGNAWNYDNASFSTIETSTAAEHDGTYGLRQFGNHTGYSIPSSLADAYIKAQPGGLNDKWTTWNKFSIDLSTASSPWLTFWYAMGFKYHDYYNNFWVQVSTDNNTWTDLFATRNAEYIPYTKKTFDLSAYIGNSQVYIRFFHNGKYATNYVYLDDISVIEIPCPDPTDQSVSNTTSSGADLSWVNPSGSNWDLYIVPTGDPAPAQDSTPTINDTSANPFTWTGGNSATDYDWYVRSDCDQDNIGTSNWVGPHSFTTDCEPFTAPYSEYFDAVTTPDLPSCWSKLILSPNTGAHITTFVTPWVSAHSYPNQIRMDNYYDHDAILFLITPQLSDLTTQLNQIRFFAKEETYGYTELIVGTMTDPADSSTFTTFDTLFLSSSYQEYTVIFGNNYSGSNQYIAFKNSPANTNYRVLIDDFIYEPIPACVVPTHLKSANNTPTGSDLSWTDNYGSNWDIYITQSPNPPTQTTTPTINDTSANPFTWTGGNEYTEYNWYVRSDCDHDNSGTSLWSAQKTFKTTQFPAPVQTIPFVEDWEAGVIGPEWNYHEDEDGFSHVEVSNSAEHDGDYGLQQFSNYSGEYIMSNTLEEAYNKSQPDSVNYLWTTWNKFSIDLSGATNPFLTFWYSLDYYYNDALNNFWVEVSTNDTTWTELFAIRTNGANIPYTKKLIDLSAYNGTAQLYIRFFHNSSTGNSHRLYLDDISVTEIPCPDPTDQTVSNQTESGADLSWINPSGSNWDLYIVPSGDPAPTQDTIPTVNDTTANPYSWTDGFANTEYDWYVRSDCDGDNTGTSNWVGPQTFTTACALIPIPYSENFDGAIEPAFPECMPIEDVNGDGITWVTEANGSVTPPNSASIEYNSAMAMDDWFFTQKLQLTGGKTYVVSFAYAADDDSYPEKIAVDWGNAAIADSMSGSPIFDNNSITSGWKAGSGSFTPDSSGDYFVGFHGYSDADMYYLYVDDIKVLEEVDSTNWNGSVDNDWDNPANWSNGLPTAATVVSIPTGLTNYPTVNMTTPIGSITIKSDINGDASLIDSNKLYAGDVTVERFISGGVWHDISASTQGQTLQSLYFGGNPNVWLTHYNEPDNSRTYLYQLTEPMNPGAGFEIWVESGNNVVIDFNGPLQTNSVNVSGSISYSGPDPLGYNLIGNPYASPISLESGTWSWSDVDNSFWVWDPSGNGSYRDYNTSTHVGSLTGGVIPMGQGFFIHTLDVAPDFSIPVDSRVHSTQPYYKNSRSNDLTKISLKAYYDNDYYDELNIAFTSGAKELYESYDTRKMFSISGTTPQVYSIIPDEELSLNSLPELKPGDQRSVTVGYRAGVNGSQTLVADLSFLEDTYVMLEDLRLKKFHNLNDNPVYTFEATNYQNPNRFVLHFNRSTTGIENNESKGIGAYAFDKNLFIVSRGSMIHQTKQLTVFDILGRKVVDKTIPDGNLIRIPLNISDAYVVVQVISNDEVYTTKVFIK